MLAYCNSELMLQLATVQSIRSLILNHCHMSDYSTTLLAMAHWLLVMLSKVAQPLKLRLVVEYNVWIKVISTKTLSLFSSKIQNLLES